MKGRLNMELIAPLVGAAVVTGGYLWLARDGAPAPGGTLGRVIGSVGLAMMLGAQSLYTLRKRVRALGGPMTWWLRSHVFLGIVGSYLALLHTAGRLGGLAGVLAWVTAALVISGFFGRFIYAATPRSHDGSELSQEDLVREREQTEARLRALGVDPSRDAMPTGASHGAAIVFLRWIYQWRHRAQIRRIVNGLDASRQTHAAEIRQLLELRFRRILEARALRSARRIFSLWHMAHVPLGMVMVVLAAVHVVTALYFSHR